MKDIILIGDSKIKSVPIIDCGDKIVDLAKEFPELLFDFNRLHVQKKSKTISHARSSVGEMLLSAQKKLPQGIKFLLKECYRPLWIQRESFEGYSSYLREKFPGWSVEKIYEECSKLNAPVDVAPHSTGGAIDLTLIDSDGNWLEMGTKFNAEPLETEYATYTHANNILELASANRKLLILAMEDAGFVNYPTEWWHWSYGDKYWAYKKSEPHAIFSSIEDFPINDL